MTVTIVLALATLGSVASYLCCTAQGGQGKYNSDCRVLLSCVAVAGIIGLTFTYGNTPLERDKLQNQELHAKHFIFLSACEWAK